MEKNIGRYRRILGFFLAVLLLGTPAVQGAEQTGPAVDLDVRAIDNNTGNLALGQRHTWILRGQLPGSLAQGKSYELTQVLDQRLRLEPGALVTMLGCGGRHMILQQDQHYTLEMSQDTGRIRLALTQEGRTFARENGGREVRLSYRASIQSRDAVGQAIPGQAALRYTDPQGNTWQSWSDVPQVHTGGFHLQLTDERGQPIAGAQFSLLDGNQQRIRQLTTDRQGRSQVMGIPYGTYTLIQTQGARGFEMLKEPVPVLVDQSSHLTGQEGWQDPEGKPVDATLKLTNPEIPGREPAFVEAAVLVAVGSCLLTLSGWLLPGMAPGKKAVSPVPCLPRSKAPECSASEDRPLRTDRIAGR